MKTELERIATRLYILEEKLVYWDPTEKEYQMIKSKIETLENRWAELNA